ncbi:MAG: hypothetical protein ACLU4N_24710 [Butyricimonas faecihominis]
MYDFTNLESRLVELPVLASNYYGNVHMLGSGYIITGEAAR